MLSLRKDKKSKKKKKDKKINVLSYAYYTFDNMPKMKIINPIIQYGAEFEEMKNRAIFDGVVSATINGGVALLFDKLDAVGLRISNISDESTFKGAYVEGVIKFSLIKIFFYLLHIISVKKRFQMA